MPSLIATVKRFDDVGGFGFWRRRTVAEIHFHKNSSAQR